MGTCVYHMAQQGFRQMWRNIGQNTEIPEYTQGIYDARELAMGRMQAEARAHRAEGIVGVQLNGVQRRLGLSHHGFFAIGTAVRPLRADHRITDPNGGLVLPLPSHRGYPLSGRGGERSTSANAVAMLQWGERGVGGGGGGGGEGRGGGRGGGGRGGEGGGGGGRGGGRGRAGEERRTKTRGSPAARPAGRSAGRSSPRSGRARSRHPPPAGWSCRADRPAGERGDHRVQRVVAGQAPLDAPARPAAGRAPLPTAPGSTAGHALDSGRL